jgi:hypothetical protein
MLIVTVAEVASGGTLTVRSNDCESVPERGVVKYSLHSFRSLPDASVTIARAPNPLPMLARPDTCTVFESSVPFNVLEVVKPEESSCDVTVAPEITYRICIPLNGESG